MLFFWFWVTFVFSLVHVLHYRISYVCPLVPAAQWYTSLRRKTKKSLRICVSTSVTKNPSKGFPKIATAV